MRKVDEIDYVIAELQKMQNHLKLLLGYLNSIQATKDPPKSAKETAEESEKFQISIFGKKVICSYCGKEMRDKINKIFGTENRPLCHRHRKR